MKLIIDSDKMFKLSVTPEGELSINLANGKTMKGSLTPEEVEQLHFRVMEVSDGALLFDPLPTDYIGLHKADMETLEAQAIELNRLRDALESAKQSEQELLTAKAELETRLADCEQLLVSARTELKNALEVVEQQASKLNVKEASPVESTPVEAAPVESTPVEVKESEVDPEAVVTSA